MLTFCIIKSIMRHMKHFVGIVAFALTFGLSTTLVGLLFGFPQVKNTQVENGSMVANRIENLLKRDLRNGALRKKARRAAYKSWAKNGSTEIKDGAHTMRAFREAVSEYVHASSTIDASDLPRDFQRAWRIHMKAWKKQADFLHKFELVFNNEKSSKISDAVNLSDSADSKVVYEAELAKLSKSYNCNIMKINRTWYQVLRVAQRYGVEIDRSYFY